MKKVLLFSVFALACLTGMMSCGKDDDNKKVELTGITVSQNSVSLYVTGSVQVQATAVPADAADVVFTWVSDNTNVATVSSSGLITGVSVGTATVTVSCGSISKQVQVTVSIEEIALQSISVDNSDVVLPVGGSVKVTATPTPSNATGVSFEWTPADPEKATVAVDGTITVTGLGETTVTVSSNGKTATVKVTGTIRSVSVADSEGNKTGQYLVGATVQLSATTDPDDSGSAIEWSSNDESIATVDGNGLVTIVGSGTATITAAAGTFTDTYVATTSSPLDKAAGFWTFDDQENLYKATIGIDLLPVDTDDGAFSFDYVAGPSATKKAIHVNRGRFEWNHQLAGESLTNYTIMIDSRVPSVPDREMYGVTKTTATSSASLGLRYRDPEGLWASTGNTIAPILDPPIPPHGEEPWIRMVISIKPNESIANEAYFSVYSDGKFVESVSKDFAWNILREGEPLGIIIGNTLPDDRRGSFVYSVSAFAVWDHVLTDEEVASLGGVLK